MIAGEKQQEARTITFSDRKITTREIDVSQNSSYPLMKDILKFLKITSAGSPGNSWRSITAALGISAPLIWSGKGVNLAVCVSHDNSYPHISTTLAHNRVITAGETGILDYAPGN